jgi:hypothetical protein
VYFKAASIRSMRREGKGEKELRTWTIGALAFLAATAVIGTFATPVEAQSFGSAQNFAILAGTSISSTGATVINGDVGISPGIALTGFPPGIINGIVHKGDAVAAQAQADTSSLYSSLIARAYTQDLTGQNLGGRALTPGTYHFGAAADLNGTLTLDAGGDPNAVFVFQIGSSFTAETGSKVLLFSGTSMSHVFFAAGSSITLADESQVSGTIQAVGTITAGSSTVDGRLFSNSGTVILNDTTITLVQAGPASAPEPQSMAVLVLGLGTLATSRLRRRS